MIMPAGRPDSIFVTTADRGPGEPELVLLLAAGRPAELVVLEAKRRKQRSLLTWLFGAAGVVAAYDAFLLFFR